MNTNPLIRFIVALLLALTLKAAELMPLRAENNAAGTTKTIPTRQEAAPQGQSTSAKTIRNPDGSSVTDNKYSNPFFGFSVEFPKGWLLFSNNDAKAEMESNERKIIQEKPELASLAKPNTSAPLLVVGEAVEYKGSGARRSFKVLANEVSAEPKPGGAMEYLNFLAEMGKAGKVPFQFFSAPEPIFVGNKKMAKAYGKMPWGTQTWYVVLYALPVKNYMLQFLLVSPDREGLNGIEPWIQTLTFVAASSK